jgi:hypothetical protein
MASTLQIILHCFIFIIHIHSQHSCTNGCNTRLAKGQPAVTPHFATQQGQEIFQKAHPGLILHNGDANTLTCRYSGRYRLCTSVTGSSAHADCWSWLKYDYLWHLRRYPTQHWLPIQRTNCIIMHALRGVGMNRQGWRGGGIRC